MKTARASRAVAHPPLSVAQRKAEFVTWFKERFFLRFHMAVILGLTFLAGLAVTKLMLVAGNTDLALRYGVAVAASYAAFLLVLKLWLVYVVRGDDTTDAVDVIDTVDGAVDVMRELSGPAPSGFRAAGGGYGGGGASGSFGGSQGSGGSGGASLVPDADEGFGLVVLAAVVLVGLAVAGGYLVYAGPAILAEAAFEALLASALIPGARRAEATGWMRPAVRATVLPFLGMFALAVGFGLVARGLCPEARRVMDVVACVGY